MPPYFRARIYFAAQPVTPSHRSGARLPPRSDPALWTARRRRHCRTCRLSEPLPPPPPGDRTIVPNTTLPSSGTTARCFVNGPAPAAADNRPWTRGTDNRPGADNRPWTRGADNRPWTKGAEGRPKSSGRSSLCSCGAQQYHRRTASLRAGSGSSSRCRADGVVCQQRPVVAPPVSSRRRAADWPYLAGGLVAGPLTTELQLVSVAVSRHPCSP